MNPRLNTEQIEYLEEYLIDCLSHEILDRGHQLTSSVKEIQQKTPGVFTGFVKDGKNYFAEINIDPYQEYCDSYCTCNDSMDCPHIAALGLSLLYGNSPSAKVVNLENGGLDLNKSIKDIFDTNVSNEYRLLPTPKEIPLEDVISILSFNYIYLNLNHIEIYLLPDNTFLIEGRNYSWQGQEDTTHFSSISLKIESNKTYIKCNCCSRKLSNLCDHQQAILNDYYTRDFIKNILNESITRNYNDIEDIYLKKFKLSSDTLRDLFNINWNTDNKAWALKRKDESMIYHPHFDDSFSNYYSKENLPDDHFLSLQESNLKKGNALLWNENGDVTVIEARFNKAKTKLISHFRETPFPLFFNPEELCIWQDLAKKVEDLNNAAILSYLKSVLPTLTQIFSFYQKDNRHYNISKNAISQIQFSSDFVALNIDYKEEKGLSTFNFAFKAENVNIIPGEIKWYNKYFLVYRQKAYLYFHKDIYDILIALDGRDKIVMIKELLAKDEGFIEKLNEAGTLKMKDEKTKKLTGGIKQIYIREVSKFLVFEPVIIYDKYKFSVYEKMERIKAKENLKILGEIELQQQFLKEIKELHQDWNKDFIPQHYVYLHIDKALEDFWILDFFEKVKELGIQVFGQENLNNLKVNTNKASISNSITSGIDWFDAEVGITFGDQEVAQSSWIEAIKNNQQYVRLSDGTFGVLPEKWINKLKKLLASAEVEKGRLRISKYRFNIVDDLFEDIDDEKLKRELHKKQDALNSYEENKKYHIPANLKADLRFYQKQGFQWLKFCEEFRFGACLADDMGLGKTVQILALLLDQKKQKKGTSLGVLPRSLLFNWANEIEKFAPDLNYLIHHGQNRNNSLDNHEKYDLVISTYDTIVRDINEIKNIEWNYVVLDESQAIKNPNSKRYKSVRLLQARHRVVMTGTPIENNTFDLFAQFSFLNPGIFGSQQSFKSQFSNPIDQLGDRETIELLKKTIYPFLLRRTKEQVANDLPDKTESVIYCEMGKEQRKQYESLKNYIKLGLQDKLDDSNAKFMILDGLLKLRQICNSPELVDATLPPKKKESVKVDTLIEILTEDISNHKALVFSQFVSMLSIIRKKLDEKGVQYAYLDGSTKDRENAVNEFMENEKCQIFLISIKAGNTGLNLTAADYVYIIDPWWNPAVEAQAIDRTHRIGQDKKVFAYKMICKDTIEEKIVSLQDKKKTLARDLIQVDESVFKSLSKTELMALFD